MSTPADTDPFAEAYAATAPLRAALDDAELVAINRSPRDVATEALHTAERLTPLAPRLAALLPDEPDPPAALTRLARALFYTDSDFRSRSADPSGPAPQSRTEPARLHARLRAALLALEVWEKVPRGSIARFGRSRRIANLLAEIGDLVRILREHLADTEALTPFRRASLDEASTYATREFVATGRARDRRRHRVDDTRTERRRAYTLLMQFYLRLRGAVAVVRAAEGDAEQLAPLLHAR